MDAATLFLVMTLPSGQQHIATREFDSLPACEAFAVSYRGATRNRTLPPGVVRNELYCVKHLRVSTAGISAYQLFVCVDGARCAVPLGTASLSRTDCEEHRLMIAAHTPSKRVVCKPRGEEVLVDASGRVQDDRSADPMDMLGQPPQPAKGDR